MSVGHEPFTLILCHLISSFKLGPSAIAFKIIITEISFVGFCLVFLGVLLLPLAFSVPHALVPLASVLFSLLLPDSFAVSLHASVFELAPEFIAVGVELETKSVTLVFEPKAFVDTVVLI